MLQRCLLLAPLAWLLLAPACQTVDAGNALELRGLMESLDDGEANQIDRPLGVAVAVVGMPIQEAYVPIAFEYGLQYMHDSGVLDGSVRETSSQLLWAGVRAELSDGKWRPHLGAGLLALRVRMRSRQSDEFQWQSDQMKSFGLYVEAGLRLRATKHWHLGLGLRQTIGLIDRLDGESVDLDFLEIFGSLGYSF